MVTCMICNNEFKQLTTSGHLRKHNMTQRAYLIMFPNAEVVSRETMLLHSISMKKRVANGTHFVPFRDIKGLARKVHDKYMEGPVEYKCIQCGKIKKTNRYFAERRKFCSNKCHSLHIQLNPKLYKERNKKISSSNIGKPKKGGYSRCNGGFRKDLGHYVRSGWEADVCRIFKYHNKPYDYESYSVRLANSKKDLTWIIDFVDPTCFMSQGFIEIKGWWDKISKRKKRLLEQQRPDIYKKITFISQKEMSSLIKQYRDIVPYWETRQRKKEK